MTRERLKKYAEDYAKQAKRAEQKYNEHGNPRHFREKQHWGELAEAFALAADSTVAKRAVHIAAVIMQAADLCRYESFSECTRRRIDEKTCVDCIEEWLLEKAEWEENNQ